MFQFLKRHIKPLQSPPSADHTCTYPRLLKLAGEGGLLR